MLQCEWRLAGKSHLGMLDGVVRSAETLCEGELCCLGHRRKVNELCLLYEIYHRSGPLCMSSCGCVRFAQ